MSIERLHRELDLKERDAKRVREWVKLRDRGTKHQRDWVTTFLIAALVAMGIAAAGVAYAVWHSVAAGAP